MSTGFLLVETDPGREAHVLELVARIPGVTGHNTLFPGTIAVKIELPRESVEPAAQQLSHLDGVRRASLYRAKHT